MKNRRILARGKMGRPMFIKSREAQGWAATAERQILASLPPSFSGPVRLTASVYHCRKSSTNSAIAFPDLDVELLCDVLEKAGVIENDRLIVTKICNKYYDKERPRVEAIIEEVEKW